MAACLGDNQRALELAGVAGIDAEIGGQLHRAAHALGDEHEAAVGEHGRVQGGEVIVIGRHHGAEILAHQLGMVAHRLADRTENHAHFGQRFPERGGHRDTVEHGVHRDLRALVFGVLRPFDAGQDGTFLQRYAELFVRRQQFRIDLVEALRTGLFLRCGVVMNILVVDRRMMDLGPMRLGHGLPGDECLKPPFQQPVGLVLARGNQPDRVLGQPLGGDVHLDVGREAPFVTGLGDGLDGVEGFCDCCQFENSSIRPRVFADAPEARARTGTPPGWRRRACRPG